MTQTFEIKTENFKITPWDLHDAIRRYIEYKDKLSIKEIQMPIKGTLKPYVGFVPNEQ